MNTKENMRIGYLTQDEFDNHMQWTAEDAREFIKLAVKEFKKDENFELFLHSVLRAVKWVGVTKVARQAGLTRQGIYDALGRENANPSFKTLTSILAVLGVKTSFTVSNLPEHNSTRRIAGNTHYAGI